MKKLSVKTIDGISCKGILQYLKTMIVCMILVPSYNTFAQTKKLHTEVDGFKWYECTNSRTKWAELPNGKKITEEFGGHQIDWSSSRYFASHKVLYLKNKIVPEGCLASPLEGGLYSTQGELITKGTWAPFSFIFKENGIILSSDYGMSGVYRDGRVVVPFGQYGKYYDILFCDSCYIAGDHEKEYNNLIRYDIYNYEGKLLASKATYKIINDMLYFSTNGYTYNRKERKIANGEIFKVRYTSQGKQLIMTKSDNNRFGLYDLSGNEILPVLYNEIRMSGGCIVAPTIGYSGGSVFDENGKCIIPTEYYSVTIDSINRVIKVGNNGKYGLYGYDGSEILAPEFQDCSLIGDNSVMFKINGYWGVMSRKTGKVYIQESRHYTKLEYNRTFKKFYFEKEGGYKGECNANGVQTSISKVQTTQSTSSSNATASSNNIGNTSYTSAGKNSPSKSLLNNEFKEITASFFKINKKYYIKSYCLISLGEKGWKDYKKGEAYVTINNKTITIKQGDGSGRTQKIVGDVKNCTVYTSHGDETMQMYILEEDKAIRAIQHKDGRITLYSYVRNIIMNKYTCICLYELYKE